MRSRVMLDAPAGRDISYLGEGMATGVCTQGEGMDVRARHVGSFSHCCFLPVTSPAARDACWVRDVTGRRGKVRSSPRAELRADAIVWEAYGR